MRAPAAVRGTAGELIEALRHTASRRRGGAGAGVDVSDLMPSGSTFLRGLSIGALVGAAIAGSAIWQHRRHRLPGPTPGPDPADVAGS